MARTALDLITASLKRINVLAGTETPTADLAEDAFERLNDLIETWTTESLTIYALHTIGRETILTQPGPSADWYNIGPSGDIDVPQRPPWISSISFINYGSGSEVPLTEYKLVAFTQDEWEQERVKLLISIQPTHYYYSPQWPHGRLFLWPQYQGTSFQLWLYVPLPLGPLASLTTLVDLPQGYFRALRDHLAIELAPELGVTVQPALMLSAQDALAQLKRVNFQPRRLSMPAGLPSLCPRPYDWRVDE